MKPTDTHSPLNGTCTPMLPCIQRPRTRCRALWCPHHHAFPVDGLLLPGLERPKHPARHGCLATQAEGPLCRSPPSPLAPLGEAAGRSPTDLRSAGDTPDGPQRRLIFQPTQPYISASIVSDSIVERVGLLSRDEAVSLGLCPTPSAPDSIPPLRGRGGSGALRFETDALSHLLV